SSVSHISLCDLNAPTEIYTLSLHDALPIWEPSEEQINEANVTAYMKWLQDERNLSFNTYAELWKWSTDEVEMFWESLWEYFEITDRKSTRLNSSHVSISYAVFCLNKKNYCS